MGKKTHLPLGSIPASWVASIHLSWSSGAKHFSASTLLTASVTFCLVAPMFRPKFCASRTISSPAKLPASVKTVNSCGWILFECVNISMPLELQATEWQQACHRRQCCYVDMEIRNHPHDLWKDAQATLHLTFQRGGRNLCLHVDKCRSDIKRMYVFLHELWFAAHIKTRWSSLHVEYVTAP